MSRSRAQRGSSLLECAAALAVAAVAVAASSRTAEATATLLRRADVMARTLDVARGLLEHELGSPCGAPFHCPAGYRCEVTRAALTAAADRVSAEVERIDGDARERLDTLAPAPNCGS